ncbi:MAG: hypothetical protein V1783_00475 [Bacteroidota bacterium]|jgi:hypothetical protein
MKKLILGIVSLTLVFALSFTLNAQGDGDKKVPQTQKVEKKKECTTATKSADCKTAAAKECGSKEAKTEKSCCSKTKVEKK